MDKNHESLLDLSFDDDENLSAFEKLPGKIRQMIYQELTMEDLMNLFIVSKKLVNV